MNTIIKWDFIPLQYEYKRADYIWEMPTPLVEKQTPFVNEWSPPIDMPVSVPMEWDAIPVSNPITQPPIELTPPQQPPIEAESFIDEKINDAIANSFEHIGSYIGDALVQLGKDFGMWILKVAPDLFGMIGMILCLGAIMSIPRTGKWAVVSVSIAVVFEILRRSTL